MTEILMVLALSTVVIGLAFSVLTLLSQNLIFVQNNYHQGSKRQLLQQQLWADFHTYPNAYYLKPVETLRLASPLDSVQYELDDGFFIRNQDTLLQNVLQIDFLFQGKKVHSGAVDALKLAVAVENDTAFMFVYHRSDAKTIMSHGN